MKEGYPRHVIPYKEYHPKALASLVAPDQIGPTTRSKQLTTTIPVDEATTVTAVIVSQAVPICEDFAVAYFDQQSRFQVIPTPEPRHLITQEHQSVLHSMASYLATNKHIPWDRKGEFKLSIEQIEEALTISRFISDDDRKNRHVSRRLSRFLDLIKELSVTDLVLKERYTDRFYIEPFLHTCIVATDPTGKRGVIEVRFRLNSNLEEWVDACRSAKSKEDWYRCAVHHTPVPLKACRYNLQKLLATMSRQYRQKDSYPVSMEKIAKVCGLSDDLKAHPKRAINKIIKETNAWAAANDQKAAIEGARVRFTRNGRSKKQQGRSLNVGQFKAIIEAIQQASGLSKNEIAKQMGCSGGTISKMLKETRTGKPVSKDLTGKLKAAFPDEVKQVAKW